MSAISKGRKDIKFIISQARGLMELDEELERVGGLEKLEREIAGRVDALKNEADGLAAKIAACENVCAAKRKEAADIVWAAQANAEKIAEQARTDDDAAEQERAKLKAEALAEIEQAKRDAGDELTVLRRAWQKLDGEIVAARASLDEINAEAVAAEARRDAANAEVERLQKLFAPKP